MENTLELTMQDLKNVWDNLPHHVVTDLEEVASLHGTQYAINATLLALVNSHKEQEDTMKELASDLLKDTSIDTTKGFVGEQANKIIASIFEMLRVMLDGTAFMSLLSHSFLGAIFSVIPPEMFISILTLLAIALFYLLVSKARKHASKHTIKASVQKINVRLHKAVNKKFLI